MSGVRMRPAQALADHAAGRQFANPARLLQSWYVAAPARSVPRGTVRSFERVGRRIAVYRAASGAIRVLDARCPHLGADLGQGTVAGDGVQCAFHGWRFGPDGRCSAAPGFATAPPRRLRVYPALERWGLIWFFNGPRPLFPLPDAPAGERLRTWRLPAQRIHCHPHLVIANGLDFPHFTALHAMEPTQPPRITIEPPYRVRLDLAGRPRSRQLQRLTGTGRSPIEASFTTIGGHLAWLTVARPFPFHVLFSGRPTPDGACDTSTVMLLPRAAPARAVRSVLLLGILLHDDRRILDSLDFVPAFTSLDTGLRAFAELVEGLEPA